MLAVVIAVTAASLLAAAQGGASSPQGTPPVQGRGGPPPGPPPVVPKSLVASGDPARSCESLSSLTLPDTTIASAVVDPGNGTIPASCRVAAVVTHPPAPDRITIWIALPMKNWNGRFQGVGG